VRIRATVPILVSGRWRTTRAKTKEQGRQIHLDAPAQGATMYLLVREADTQTKGNDMTDEQREPVYFVLAVDPNCDGDTTEQVAMADESPSVRISNPDAENGYGACEGPLDWLNSAKITVDADEDSVSCLVSVGDPRGAFCMTVRRLPDGRIVLHLPHPGESMPHMTTEALHEGTLVVVG